jgi:hypothetical protein
MEQAITFNTHAYVKKLRLVEFTEEQVEVLATTHVELIVERLATKRDIVELKTGLKGDIRESELRLEAKISEQKVILIKWIIRIAFVQVTLIIALVMLL